MGNMKIITDNKCYNCTSDGTTREHIVPKFLLCHKDPGFTVPCCANCQGKLHWLDNYAAAYFLFHRSQTNHDDWKKWLRESIIQNGSPLFLRYFGDDVVANENALLYWIHKICVGITYRLYGKLDNSYILHITTNFSQLGGFSSYNDADNQYSDDMTQKMKQVRNMMHDEFNKLINTYGIVAYDATNVLISFTGDRIVHGARLFRVRLFKIFSIVCGIAESNSLTIRNMVLAKLPIQVNLDDVNRLHVMLKADKHGDRIAAILANHPTSNESRVLRRVQLEAAGMSSEDIEILENRFTDYMKNQGGNERLADILLKEARDQRKEQK